MTQFEITPYPTNGLLVAVGLAVLAIGVWYAIPKEVRARFTAWVRRVIRGRKGEAP